MARDWFGRICVFFYFSLLFAEAASQSSPCFAYVDFLPKRTACTILTFVEMRVKWSVTLTDRLGPEILTVFEIKRQVPGWL